MLLNVTIFNGFYQLYYGFHENILALMHIFPLICTGVRWIVWINMLFIQKIHLPRNIHIFKST